MKWLSAPRNLFLGFCVIFSSQASLASGLPLDPYAIVPSTNVCSAKFTYDPFHIENGFVLQTDVLSGLKKEAESTLKKGGPKVDGGLNFRETKAGRIFGVAQPTEPGYENVLQEVKSLHPEVKKIVWINLREEPVFVIEGESYGVRTLSDIRDNVVSGTISRQNVAKYEQRILDSIEQRLKQDHLTLHYLNNDSSDISENIHALSLTEKSSLKTLSELLNELNAKWNASGVQFYRVPISDTDAPTANDFDALKSIYDDSAKDVSETAYVLNCQFGHGRTTTGDVLFEMLRYSDHSPAIDLTKYLDDSPALSAIEKLLPNGKEASILSNRAMDLNDTVLNLRENALSKLEYLKTHPGQAKVSEDVEKSLRRYDAMVVFQSYLLDPVSKAKSYSEWLELRPELKKALLEPLKLIDSTAMHLPN